MTTKLPQPPGICDQCYCDQTHHPLDTGQGVYYCGHNDTLAIVKTNLSGWIVESGVKVEEWIRRRDNAEATLDLLGAGLKKTH